MSAAGSEQPLNPTSSRNKVVPSRRPRVPREIQTPVQHLRTRPGDRFWRPPATTILVLTDTRMIRVS